VKALFAAAMLALSPMLLPQAPADSTKAAPTHAVVVSLNRLAAESTDGKAANLKLTQLAQKMAGDLSAREKDGTTKPEELQKIRQQAQNDFAGAQRQAQTEMRAKLNPIISEIAAQHGADLVLSGDTAVVWAAPKLDITAEVLTKMNEPPK
jgi:Skp family chaperone for outer membrane proteins